MLCSNVFSNTIPGQWHGAEKVNAVSQHYESDVLSYQKVFGPIRAVCLMFHLVLRIGKTCTVLNIQISVYGFLKVLTRICCVESKATHSFQIVHAPECGRFLLPGSMIQFQKTSLVIH